MASGKEIKSKIGSIKNTQERVASSRPYAENLRQVIGRVAQANLDFTHPFLEEREVKRVGYIVISTDRGLCGGLNSNEFKKVALDVKAWKEKGVEAEFTTLGSKAAGFFQRFGGKLVAKKANLGDTPSLQDVIGPVKTMLDAYSEGKIDRLYVVFNKFVNTMKQEPTIDQLLPLPKAEEEVSQHSWDYLYEPNPEAILEALLVRFIESQVYQGVVENAASEQAARMVAMKAATDNAGDLMDELQLVYNKARQAAITQEISEIVGGSAAV